MTAKHFRLLAYAETNKYTNASDIIIVEYGVAYAHDSRSPDIVKHHAITRQSCRFGTQSTRDEPERKKQKCVVLKKNAHSQTNRILPSEHPHFAFNTTMTRKYPAHKNKHFRWVHFWCLFVCYSLVDANFNSSSSLTAIRSFFSVWFVLVLHAVVVWLLLCHSSLVAAFSHVPPVDTSTRGPAIVVRIRFVATTTICVCVVGYMWELRIHQ